MSADLANRNLHISDRRIDKIRLGETGSFHIKKSNKPSKAFSKVREEVHSAFSSLLAIKLNPKLQIVYEKIRNKSLVR